MDIYASGRLEHRPVFSHQFFAVDAVEGIGVFTHRVSVTQGMNMDSEISYKEGI